MVGQVLRHYRIEAKLGAGGMGVVYRARDTHLDRSVAIKVLPGAALANRERRIRFVQEAKAASALSHPNIVTIHDIDTAISGEESVDFIAMEYISGQTLDHLVGHKGLRLNEALRYAAQIADALAAAHAVGIVHRDLKPANIMITEQGAVKLLDFGLAKLSEPLETDVFAATESLKLDFAQTEQGTILGTVAYMSPEQAEGRKVDARSDIFTFGEVLYEMVTGRKAFSGDSKVSTLASILHKEPPPLADSIEGAPPELERLIARCLKKDPQRRWQSMADIKVALAEVEEELAAVKVPEARKPARPSSSVWKWLWPAFVLIALAGGMYIGWFAFKPTPPSFQRLTFRRGEVEGAKFAPDGQTIVYSAQWDTEPFTIFSTRQGSRESRSLDLPEGKILSISSSGEMAILLGSGRIGTLARVPLAGGAPREMAENVSGADWGPDGTSLAVVRRVGTRYHVEYPIGKTLYETDGAPYSLRISRTGDAIAFFDYDREVGEFAVTVVDLSGHKRVLSRGWRGMGWLGWSPKGNEIWFCGLKAGGDPALRAVTRDGKERVVMEMPAWTLMDDIARDGRVLLEATNSRIGISYQPSDGSPERDLSWLDTSLPYELSRDGKTMLFAELSYGDGRNTAIYLRKTDGSPAVRLGDGIHPALSPDGKWVLCVHADGSRTQLMLLPTGAGDARMVGSQGLRYESAQWFPDGKRILFTANAPNRPLRTYVQSLDGGDPAAVTPEGAVASLVSPSGKYAVVTAGGKLSLCTLEGGNSAAASAREESSGTAGRRVADLEPGETPIGWGESDNTLFLSKPESGGGASIHRMNLTTGKQELWRQLKPADPVGLSVFVQQIAITPDGKSYAYGVQRDTSSLYLAQGLR